MSDHKVAGGMQPPGWLYDDESGRTRWWDGVRWTDLVKPLDPVVRTAPAYAPAPPTTVVTHASEPAAKNGAASAAILFVVLGALGLAAGAWLIGGLDPSAVAVLAVATGVVIAVALVLSIVGLVVGVRRPAKKAGAIVALIGSTALSVLFVLQVLAALAP